MAGKKILVADDSLTIQKVIRLALSGDGYEIQTVSDGQEAVEQATLFRPDICIIDVSLPTKDAYQIRQEFISKPDLRNIPVIMMSSAFERVDEARMTSLGFSGHLIKPFDPSHLRSTLLAVTNQAPKNDPIAESIKPVSPPTPKNISPKEVLTPKENFNIAPTKSDIFSPVSAFDLADSDLPALEMDHSVDDIQQLTKSTFEMSGLDQQDWGVIEPMKEENFTQPQNTVQLTSVSPAKAQNPFAKDQPTKTSINQVPMQPAPSQQFQTAPGNMEQTPHYSTAAPTITVSQENLEGIINAQVEKLLIGMKDQINTRLQEIFNEEYKHYTQAKMPEMAEKVIKEEIHKLLNEPPV